MTKHLTIVSKKIECNDEILELTNQRVLFWSKENALILSDIHIGKSGHFQKSGIPIPSSVLQKDLMRLENLINHFSPNKMIVVGDLFHASYNKELDAFKDWLKQFQELEIHLIKGNHDRLSNRIYEDFNIKIYQKELVIGKLKFVHDFDKIDENLFTISGHTHPGVSIKGKGRQRIKLPCFQVTNHQLILPAFSLFTGLNTRNCPENCTNYCFTNDEIFEV